MTLTAWRITKRKHAKTAFSGEAARQFGGRWNHPGVAVVYTAGSQSLAALEMLVHLDSSELLQKYVLFEVAIEESLVTQVERSQLPRDWRADPASSAWGLSPAAAVCIFSMMERSQSKACLPRPALRPPVAVSTLSPPEI